MENQFLRSVARAFVQNSALDCVFVLPNRRSLKFFQMYLGKEYGAVTGKPLFSPKIITISDFFAQLGGLVQADNVEQLYLLYKEYILLKFPSIPFEQAILKEPFDEFIHWGDTILKDFNDIDKYMVDARQLFTNIQDLKELENDYSFLTQKQFEAVKTFWANYLRGGELSQKKEFFASIWGIMHNLYENFKEALALKGMGYEGQIYRSVAEGITDSEFEKKVVFIGLNAPNKCEKKVMQHLRDTGKGDFYWDFYGPMLTDPQNGASEIISAFVKEFPSGFNIDGGAVDIRQQRVSVYASPSGVGQAFVVADILDKLFPGESVDARDSFSTAVVLPDENLLLPVLNSIPEKFKSINVTMGYPITTTPLISFMDLVKQLQLDVREKNGKICFYHKSLIGVLSHGYIKQISPDGAKKIKERVIKGNLIYVPQGGDVLECEDEFLAALLRVARYPKEIAAYLLNLLAMLDERVDTWEREFVYQYYLKVKRLDDLDIPMEGKTWFRLLEQLCRGIVVPFKGEPLAGLQVMGTLETRALDFDNVIIISANEGKFPSASVAQSVVPYNLRIGFGLPTYELQDGIAAYHFYRSICRAKNIFMVYDTRNEGLGSGEASRYVKQLKYHFGAQVQEEAVAVAVQGEKEGNRMAVVKDDALMELLVERFAAGGSKSLSASAINNYIACPLKFYFENVEGLKEEDEISESVESNVFGSIFHYVMENLYKGYEGKRVAPDDIEAMMRNRELVSRLIVDGFKEYMKVEELSGQHKIVEALIQKYVNLALALDKGKAPFRYEKGEGEFRYELPVNNGAMQVNFRAFVDRIDRIIEGNVLRIIDYKTGSVDMLPKGEELGVLFDKLGEGKYKAVLQLYLYALICLEKKICAGELSGEVELVIYPLKKISKDGIASLKLEEEKLQTFKGLLVECVEEIFNSEVPFYANPQKKRCGYCSHAALCGR